MASLAELAEIKKWKKKAFKMSYERNDSTISLLASSFEAVEQAAFPSYEEKQIRLLHEVLNGQVTLVSMNEDRDLYLLRPIVIEVVEIVLLSLKRKDCGEISARLKKFSNKLQNFKYENNERLNTICDLSCGLIECLNLMIQFQGGNNNEEETQNTSELSDRDTGGDRGSKGGGTNDGPSTSSAAAASRRRYFDIAGDILDKSNMHSRFKQAFKSRDLMKESDQLLMPAQINVQPQLHYDTSRFYKPFLLPNALFAKYRYRNEKEIYDPKAEDREMLSIDNNGRLYLSSPMSEASEIDRISLAFLGTFKCFPEVDTTMFESGEFDSAVADEFSNLSMRDGSFDEEEENNN